MTFDFWSPIQYSRLRRIIFCDSCRTYVLLLSKMPFVLCMWVKPAFFSLTERYVALVW
jgi:hypothetical protein